MDMLRPVQAIALLPGMATIVIPGVIISSTGAVNPGWSLPSPLNGIPLMAGGFLIGAGLLLMVKTITLFATVGKGTLAPWTPTQKLVLRGAYRSVRNPMISGVFCVLLGESVLFGSLPLLYWFLAFVLANAVYIPLFEEPGLQKRFGEAYVQYKKNVPRWIPRFHPWDATNEDQAGRGGT
jgi:protein-S-isoprenylcysteine O-methyltransferase Ste14